MTTGDKKLEEAYVEEAPREVAPEEEKEADSEDLERSLMLSADMRIYYRKMSSQTYEMYKKRKHEVVEGGVSENKKGEELANAANAAVTKLKRGAYREWCDEMDDLLEKVSKLYLVANAPKVRDKDTTEDTVVNACDYLGAESGRRVSIFVGEILGQYWFVNHAYKEFIKIAGREE